MFTSRCVGIFDVYVKQTRWTYRLTIKLCEIANPLLLMEGFVAPYVFNDVHPIHHLRFHHLHLHSMATHQGPVLSLIGGNCGVAAAHIVSGIVLMFAKCHHLARSAPYGSSFVSNHSTADPLKLGATMSTLVASNEPVGWFMTFHYKTDICILFYIPIDSPLKERPESWHSVSKTYNKLNAFDPLSWLLPHLCSVPHRKTN